MISLKGKDYQLKTLFIRDEAKLAKQLQLLADSDLEVKAEAMIQTCHILTGIDVGDLGGSTIAEVRDLLNLIMAERQRLAAVEPGNQEAPSVGAKA